MASIAAQRKAEEDEEKKTSATWKMVIIVTAYDCQEPLLVASARKAYTEMQKMGYDLTDFEKREWKLKAIMKMLKEKKIPPWCHDNPSITPEILAIYSDLWKEIRDKKTERATAYGEVDQTDPHHNAKWMAVMVVACHSSYPECRQQMILAARMAYSKFLEAGETLADYYDDQTVADMLWTLIPYTRK